MEMFLKEIAEFVHGELFGENIKIVGINSLELAKENELSFVANERYESLAYNSRASALIVKEKKNFNGKPIIVVDDPLLAFAKIMQLFIPSLKRHGIHPSAILKNNVKLGNNVSIGAYCVIEDNTIIEDDCIIFPFVYIGENVVIKKNARIYSNVSIYNNVKVGENVIIHSGAVIGSDGFGYVKDKDGTYVKIYQFGGVIIEDNCEIGANVAIDRATFGNTIIGKGTKIDNLCQIAHNVIIGKNVILAGQVGLSGSVKIGDNAILAGQVGVADHVEIGNDAIILAKSGISKNVPPNAVMFGYPAKERKEAIRDLLEISSIPKLKEKLKEIEKKLQK
jgi:UDP-3-O-[3-hydroxymyristoyl] glucosamine N-acyltransferase